MADPIKEPGKFVVDLTDLNLSHEQLRKIEQAINKAVLGELAGQSSGGVRSWGSRGGTMGIIVRTDPDW